MAFKSKTSSSIGQSGGATTVSDTVSGSTTHVIIGLVVSNKTTSNITATVLVNKTGSGTDTYIVKDAPIASGGSLIVIGGDQKLVLEATDVIKAYSSAATSADVILSYLIGT